MNAIQRLSKQFIRGIQVVAQIRTMASQVKVGDTLPSVQLQENTPMNKVNITDLCANKKVVIFGVPGAFTPGCDKTHLPGYIQRAEELKKKGFDEIICVSVNDVFVMKAWGDKQNAEGKVRMLADPTLDFTKALGVEQNLAPLGGLRSKRYSIIAENNKIVTTNVEPDGTGLSCSLANKIDL